MSQNEADLLKSLQLGQDLLKELHDREREIAALREEMARRDAENDKVREELVERVKATAETAKAMKHENWLLESANSELKSQTSELQFEAEVNRRKKSHQNRTADRFPSSPSSRMSHEADFALLQSELDFLRRRNDDLERTVHELTHQDGDDNEGGEDMRVVSPPRLNSTNIKKIEKENGDGVTPAAEDNGMMGGGMPPVPPLHLLSHSESDPAGGGSPMLAPCRTSTRFEDEFLELLRSARARGMTPPVSARSEAGLPGDGGVENSHLRGSMRLSSTSMSMTLPPPAHQQLGNAAQQQKHQHQRSSPVEVLGQYHPEILPTPTSANVNASTNNNRLSLPFSTSEYSGINTYYPTMSSPRGLSVQVQTDEVDDNKYAQQASSGFFCGFC
eukprot:PhM_4_TR12249/c0_g1_i1/m.48781